MLSFPAWNDRRVLRRRDPFYLGDLAICLPVCARQAREEKRPLSEELALMLVHGMLHLTGYDHDSELKQRVMWAETDRLLALTRSVRRPRIQLRPGATR
jgi:rRNA maturation RNase YbeY